MTNKLLLAATMAVGLAAGGVPAFAQSAATGQPGVTAPGNNATSAMQAQNFNQPQTTAAMPGNPPNYGAMTTAPAAQSDSNPAHWTAGNPWNYDVPGG